MMEGFVTAICVGAAIGLTLLIIRGACRFLAEVLRSDS